MGVGILSFRSLCRTAASVHRNPILLVRGSVGCGGIVRIGAYIVLLQLSTVRQSYIYSLCNKCARFVPPRDFSRVSPKAVARVNCII
jgi:hypothetical protein